MQLFKSPKERFLEELIESTRRTMLEFARLHLKDSSQAEDVVQETCYTAWVKIDVLMSSPNPGGWLMNTLKNHIRKHYDKIATERKILEALTLEAASKTASVDTTYEYSIAEILSPEELRIVQLRAQGYKHDEIAVLLNMKSGTVRTKLSRIKDKVTMFLED